MTQNIGDLLGFNGAAAVFVEEGEGSSHVLLVEQSVLVDRSRAPLAKVDCTAMVSVCVHENFLCTLIDNFERHVGVQLSEAVNELLFLDQTIAVLVPLIERLSQLSLLSLSRQMARHESQCRLLHLGFVFEIHQVVDSLRGEVRIIACFDL